MMLLVTHVAVDPILEEGGHVLELYMHDILGGSNPTARPVTGLLGSIYSGHFPFAIPSGFIPLRGGVIIPNANGVTLGTGLAGTSYAGTPNGANNNNNCNGITTQLRPDNLGLGFGTITVFDDGLTIAPELGSQVLGKAQGVYVASSADGTTQMMTFTAIDGRRRIW